MLNIIIPETEIFNEESSEFIQIKSTRIVMEHSLVSLSKWESFYKKPFLVRDEKTIEESLYYYQCMTITQNVDIKLFEYLSEENVKKINSYIDNSMTATTFTDRGGTCRDIITAEVIYGWMVALRIPFECQKWHINRLMTLIRVCNIQNSDETVPMNEQLISNKELNEKRKKALNTTG